MAYYLEHCKQHFILLIDVLGVPSGKCQRGEFVYLLWNVPIQIFAMCIYIYIYIYIYIFFFIILEV